MTKENTFLNKIPHIISILILIIIASLCMYRSQFGFDWSDETYYSAMAYNNLISSDIFQNMYHLSFWSLVLTPFVMLSKLYNGGTTDGIILFFRMAYALLNLSLAIYLYRTVARRTSIILATLAAAMVIIFVPFGIPTLSYNTLAIGLTLWSVLLFYRSIENLEETKISKYNLFTIFLSGLALGLAMLSYPTLGITLPLIPIYLIYLKRKYPENISLIKSMTLWSLGILSVPLLVILYLLMSYTPKEILDNIKNIWSNLSNYDNGLNSAKPFDKLYEPMKEYFGQYLKPIFWLTLISLLLSFLKFDRIRKVGAIILWLAVIYLQFKILNNLYETKDIFFPLIPLTLTLPAIYFLNGRYASRYLLLYVFGLFTALAISLATNNFYSYFGGFLLSSIATILLIGDYLKKNTDRDRDRDRDRNRERDTDTNTSPTFNKIAYISASIIGIIVVMSLGNARMNLVYRDEKLEELNTRIESGPLSGIYTTEESARKYEIIYSDILEYSPDEGTVLYSRILPLGYLCTDLKPSGPKMWSLDIASKEAEDYFRKYPERLPDFVFVVGDDYGYKFRSGRHSNSRNPVEGYLGDILNSPAYKKIELDSGTAYYKED